MNYIFHVFEALADSQKTRFFFHWMTWTSLILLYIIFYLDKIAITCKRQKKKHKYIFLYFSKEHWISKVK